MQKLTNNFTVEEFEKSSTAEKYRIDNRVPNNLRENLYKLACMLQTVRDEFGEAIIVSSGYRCPDLNTKIKGALNSQHMKAEAADIHTVSDSEVDNMKLWNLICEMVKSGKITCGQYIFEYGHKNIGPSWIHLSLPTPKLHNQQLFIGCK